MSSSALEILDISPAMGCPGGIVHIRCHGYRPGLPSDSGVLLGEVRADIISASQELVVIRLPEGPKTRWIALEVQGERSQSYPFALAAALAGSLHPVTNPAVAPDGSIVTTISGTRGQKIPQPLVRISRTGDKFHYPCEVMNPTGLAFGPDQQLYISSRSEGTVYRYASFETLETFADNLGVCCGIAFDSAGHLFAGDRSGKIYRIEASGDRREFARLEPSISAYHLAFDLWDNLYVTCPTISVRDALYRIDPQGKVQTVLRGLARPQGLAVAKDGSIWIAASYGGKKGVFRYLPDSGEITLHVAGPMLVGLALAGDDIFLADSSSIFWLSPTGSE